MTASATPANVNERALHALGQLPPFSPILNRLIASLAREDVSFAKLADLIEKDTVLAGNILRLVNSALYGLRGTVNSIPHAVSLLGINKLRNATLSMSVARMWNQMKTPPGWSMVRFNLHSVGVAILSDLLAQRLAVSYAEGAFAAGLFHDLGLLLIALGLPEALASWNLPEPIQKAVQCLDTPLLDTTPAEPDEISLSRVLNAADRYVKGAGISLALFEGNPEDGKSALESLGLGERVPAILSEFESEFEAIQPYF